MLSSWTQTSAASYNSWNSARVNQAAWAEYGFNWSTDYCSSSPDNPLGFTFNLSCYRHDFGYRNYKAVGQFPANKSRLDSAFYEDLKRVCATYNSVVRPACYSLAWTYYQAVKHLRLGSRRPAGRPRPGRPDEGRRRSRRPQPADPHRPAHRPPTPVDHRSYCRSARRVAAITS